MGTKCRESIAERAKEARKEADRLACEAWNQRMLGYKGPAQPSRRSVTPSMRVTVISKSGASAATRRLSYVPADDRPGDPPRVLQRSLP
jgi:hypothetical protein